MTVNHSSMSESVPRVPENFFSSGPSGTDIILVIISHRRDKSPVG